ncbi:MAG: hypothetical protein ACKO2G_04560 [Verrucomicrobiales bacterium]
MNWMVVFEFLVIVGALPLLSSISVALSAMASFAFAAMDVKAVTWHPHLARNWTAKLPSPPMPITPPGRPVSRLSPYPPPHP